MGIISGKIINTSLQNSSRLFNSNVKTQKYAGIIVIGDEILNGSVLDTNSNYLSKALYKLGIKVCKVSVIGDCVDEIASETRQFSEKYDYVLTTGGIGPTPDDVTFEAVAKAFGKKLVPNPTLIKVCSQFYKTEDLEAPGMKLAFIPEGARLTFGENKATGKKMHYPNISIKNVFIFPGIPELLRKGVDILAPQLFSSSSKFFSSDIHLNVTEDFVVNALKTVVVEYPDVVFGSYPVMYNSNYKVKLTIQSTNEMLTKEATEKLRNMIPNEFIVKL